MWWHILIGVVILFAGILDLIWTTLGTHGGGPLSSPLMNLTWNGLVALHRRSPHHRLLSFAGSFLLFSLLLFWVAIEWAGWVLVFGGTKSGLVVAKTGEAVDFWTRMYFVGSTMFTAGTNEFVPRGGAWQMATALTAGSGLIVVTVGITYVIAVLDAAIGKRTVATFIWDMGATPERIIDRAWDGERFIGLDQHLVDLAAALEQYGENHLAYPILHYFHAENRRTAAALRVAALFDALLLMGEGCAPDVRPPRIILLSARDAVEGFAEVIEEELGVAAEQPPPRPDRNILLSRGIPACSEAEFNAAVDKEHEVRRRLLGAVEQAGWTWPELASTQQNPT